MAHDQATPILAPPEPLVSSPAAAVPTDAVPNCQIVSDPDQLAVHLAIRHAVFVLEQAIFPESDRDGHDGRPTTVHVIAWDHTTPIGTVRLYLLAEPGHWQGDRLAVLPRHRGRRSAEILVRFAVRCASERGGRRMEAQVQIPNVDFFCHLGWRVMGAPDLYCGQLHQAMIIDL